MHQKKHADRKDEHERADEESEIKVKIPYKPVETPSHAAWTPK
jgi:hypothetical protein